MNFTITDLQFGTRVHRNFIFNPHAVDVRPGLGAPILNVQLSILESQDAMHRGNAFSDEFEATIRSLPNDETCARFK